MTSQPVVMKFGGTSVADAEAFRRVTQLVGARAAECPVVVVVSAMSRVTDALLSGVTSAVERGADEAFGKLEEHFARHAEVAAALANAEEREAFGAELDAARLGLGELLRACASRERPLPELRDEVVSHGEQLSAALLAAVLRGAGTPARHVDARRCLVTDDHFGRAAPLMKETERCTRAEVGPALEEGRVPVLGGFIAATQAGQTTTLGRGGSDYTASVVGACLGAREIQIWTDVSGVLTADPRVVPSARTIPRLSFAEAAELAFFGAKVLHPKTILPAVVRGIPVRICNSRAPDAGATVIYFDTDRTPRTVKGIAHKKGVAIVHVTSARMLGAYGFLRALFEIFERHETAVDLVTTSEVSVSLSLDDTRSLDAIMKDLERIGAARVEHARALVCVVGEGLRNTPGIAAKVFTAVRDINVMLISQGASSINLTFVVEEEAVEDAVRKLHRAFFDGDTRELYRSAVQDC
ncbi:MAG TPA: lysine-sensitive aspartokinase 3 [Pyrinomonadaceae bacterium]|nr:lysine-sensitive aspartokinase 3 [Pyrinomonadaceae bacterium]